jgi:hypothetical protein
MKTTGALRARPADHREAKLFQRVATIIEAARGRVAHTVNSAMVHAYWRIGREIVEVEQRGEHRAGYGEELMNRLARRLADRYGKGFGQRTLRRVRLFYLIYPNGSALLSDSSVTGENSAPQESESGDRQIRTALLSESTKPDAVLFPPHLGWTHYLVLLRVADPMARAFYEIEAAREGWAGRELERQIASLLFERIARSRDKKTVLTLDGDHFYVDLVFFNRLLRCFVLIDLKLGKLTHQDLGQMMMYVSWFDRFQRTKHERPTVGLVLCSEKNDAVVKFTLPQNNRRILAARYQRCLPTEEELRAEIARSRSEAERALRR